MAQGFGPAVMARFNAKVDSLEDGNRELAIKAGDEIAEVTRQHIKTRGTAKSGKQGRIDTRAMLNSVESEVTKDTPEEVEVQAGYHDAPFYTVFQELGTRRIEAMNALADAAEQVIPKLARDIQQNVRKS